MSWENHYKFDKDGNELVLDVELPGFDKGDIKLDVVDHGIEIKARKKSEMKKKDEKKGIYSYAKSYVGFSRFISLPEEAEADRIDATYHGNILTIHIPKKKRIEVNKEVIIK